MSESPSNPPGNSEEFALDINAYFERIAYTGPMEPTFEVLCNLLEAHITHIPFENIDVMLDRGISLDIRDLQEKLIFRKRGGYCFEINTLFAALLSNLGFEITIHGGRVYFGRDNRKERPRTHMVLMVHLNRQRWLVDATFGALGLRSPVCLTPNAKDGLTPNNSGQTLRLVPIADGTFSGGMLLQSFLWKSWHDLYGFDAYPMLPIDRIVANFYTSTFPTSPFRNTLLVMIAGRPGSASAMIRGLELTLTDGIKQEIECMQDHEAIFQKLADIFSISIDRKELELIV